MAYGILKRCQTIDNARSINRLLMAYLDQEKKDNAITVDEAMRQAGWAPDVYEQMLALKQAPQRPGVDFIPSVYTRPVRIFGTLEAEVRRSRPNGKFVSMEEDLKLASSYWIEKTKNQSRKGVHMVFSVEPKFQKQLLDNKIPVEEILFASAVDSMGEYGAWLYPNQSLGHVVGYHSDKPNSHLHMLVFPQTSSGKPINLSRGAIVKDGAKNIRVDTQAKIHSSYTSMMTILEDGIKHGPKRPKMDPKLAFEQFRLLTACFQNATIEQGKDGVSSASSMLENYKNAAAGLLDPLSRTAFHAKAQELYQKTIARLTSGPARKTYLTARRTALVSLIAAGTERTDRLKNAFNSMRQSQRAWINNPDRKPDIRGYFMRGSSVPESGEQNPLAGSTILCHAEAGNTEAMDKIEELRLARVGRDCAKLGEGFESLHEVLSNPDEEAVRHIKVQSIGARICDVAEADRGKEPPYINPGVSARPTNDFLSSPDMGKQAVEFSADMISRSFKERRRQFNPSTDGTLDTTQANADGSPDDRRSFIDEESQSAKPAKAVKPPLKPTTKVRPNAKTMASPEPPVPDETPQFPTP